MSSKMSGGTEEGGGGDVRSAALDAVAGQPSGGKLGQARGEKPGWEKDVGREIPFMPYSVRLAELGDGERERGNWEKPQTSAWGHGRSTSNTTQKRRGGTPRAQSKVFITEGIQCRGGKRASVRDRGGRVKRGQAPAATTKRPLVRERGKRESKVRELRVTMGVVPLPGRRCYTQKT